PDSNCRSLERGCGWGDTCGRSDGRPQGVALRPFDSWPAVARTRPIDASFAQEADASFAQEAIDIFCLVEVLRSLKADRRDEPRRYQVGVKKVGTGNRDGGE